MKQKSLINKTLWQFLICTAIIFALMTPLFYLLTKHFYAEDLIDVIRAVEMGQTIPELDLESDIMAGVMIQYVLTFLLLALAMFVTVRFITRRLWQPFDDTLCKAEQFNLAQSDVPVFAATDIAEFSRLNESLERLMAKNKETFRIQKEFTENASHELQTPLAVTRSKLDLLMQENLSQPQLEIVSDLYQLNTRMGQLNRNLLLLAKIENAQYNQFEKINLADFIEKALPSYNLLKTNCTVLLETESPGDIIVKANPILLECLLNNLVVNALRHTELGEIRIIMSDTGDFEVRNPAANGPLDSSTVFSRFRSGDYQTTGLGLAIVKAICDFHRWGITYAYSEHTHCFRVSISEVHG